MTVLVTGANGFVGRALCEHLVQSHVVIAQTRHTPTTIPLRDPEAQKVRLIQAHLDQSIFQHNGLDAVRCVVHCAARVHQVNDTAADPLAAYRKVNTQQALTLARAAADTGIKRFIFLSSIKVHGDISAPGRPMTISDMPAPSDAYGLSKYEAEIGLREIAMQTGMEVVIIRPPLVYGPGVKANFLSMTRTIARGWPLPLGSIHNRRSLVALDNLVDLITTCVDHPAAAHQTFLVSDQHDVSTTDLLRMMGEALGKPARLLPVSQTLLRAGLSVVGKGALAQRLFADLAVDSSETTRALGWTPPVRMQDALKATADHFLAQQA